MNDFGPSPRKEGLVTQLKSENEALRATLRTRDETVAQLQAKLQERNVELFTMKNFIEKECLNEAFRNVHQVDCTALGSPTFEVEVRDMNLEQITKRRTALEKKLRDLQRDLCEIDSRMSGLGPSLPPGCTISPALPPPVEDAEMGATGGPQAECYTLNEITPSHNQSYQLCSTSTDLWSEFLTWIRSHGMMSMEDLKAFLESHLNSRWFSESAPVPFPPSAVPPLLSPPPAVRSPRDSAPLALLDNAAPTEHDPSVTITGNGVCCTPVKPPFRIQEPSPLPGIASSPLSTSCAGEILAMVSHGPKVGPGRSYFHSNSSGLQLFVKKPDEALHTSCSTDGGHLEEAGEMCQPRPRDQVSVSAMSTESVLVSRWTKIGPSAATKTEHEPTDKAHHSQSYTPRTHPDGSVSDRGPRPSTASRLHRNNERQPYFPLPLCNPGKGTERTATPHHLASVPVTRCIGGRTPSRLPVSSCEGARNYALLVSAPSPHIGVSRAPLYAVDDFRADRMDTRPRNRSAPPVRIRL